MTGLTGTSAYGVEGASDMRTVAFMNAIGRADPVSWYGPAYHFTPERVVLEGNLTARHYILDVSENRAIPFIEQHLNLWIFQHNNARPHSANITSDFLHFEGVSVLPWPAFSPDLNPLEHI